MSRVFAAASAVAALTLQHTFAVRESGSVAVPANHAVFLSKFCFDSDRNGGETGHMQAALQSTTPDIGEMLLVVFDDEATSYSDKKSHVGKVFEFECNSAGMYSSSKWYRWVNGSNMPDPHAVDIHLGGKVRPRWWYLAVADCSGMDRIVEYSVHMTNPQQGWQSELSMDTCGLALLTLFFVAYSIIALTQMCSLQKRNVATSRHAIRVMLAISTVCSCCGMLLSVISSALLALHGERYFWVYMTAKLDKTCSKFFLMAILLLLSEGRCVSSQLQRQDLISVGKRLVPFFLACLLLEMWGEQGQIRNYTNDFIYCTRQGAALILIELCYSFMYICNLRNSYLAELEQKKRFFYLTWGSLYSVAFFVLPISTLISFACGPWARAGIIMFLTNLFHCLLLACLVIGLWPENAHKAFCIDLNQPAYLYGAKSEILAIEDGPKASYPTLLNATTQHNTSKHLLKEAV